MSDINISNILTYLENKYILEEKMLNSYKETNLKQSNLTIKLFEHNLDNIKKLIDYINNLDLTNDAGFKIYNLKKKIENIDNELIYKNK